MRGAGTGRSLLKPGDLIVQENLRVLVATEQGLFVSIRAGSSTEKRGLQQKEGNERGELMQKKRKRSTRQSPGTAEGDQAEVLLGFLPKLHLSDEVRLAEELFDLLQVRTGCHGGALCDLLRVRVYSGQVSKEVRAASGVLDVKSKHRRRKRTRSSGARGWLFYVGHSGRRNAEAVVKSLARARILGVRVEVMQVLSAHVGFRSR